MQFRCECGALGLGQDKLDEHFALHINDETCERGVSLKFDLEPPIKASGFSFSQISYSIST